MLIRRFGLYINHLNGNSKFKARHFQSFHSETLLTHLRNISNLQSLQSIHASMIKHNAVQDCYLMNQFISACSSLNHIEYASLIFSQMESPNVFVYNALIRGLVQCGNPMKGLGFYLEMLRVEILPTSYTFSSLIKGCSALMEMGFGEGVYCQVWKNGFCSNMFVLTALIDFYGSLDKIADARKVFDEMLERDLFVWTSMISAYAQRGDMCSAKGLFDEMAQRNTIAWNAMIDGFARLGNTKMAASLFDQMPVKDLISWTTMIKCYSQNSQYREALAVFNEMMKNGVSPDEVTIATVISACAHLGALELGKEMHIYVMQKRLLLDVYIGSALIDMYAKCGKVDRSLVVFYKLREKNLFCWNSVIEGLAVHGQAKEALAMFNQMLKEKINPNGVTFVSVLSACTHAGLVKEGREIFMSMNRDFSISPGIEHYGCMVDLLCKAGLLEKALQLIRSMKTEPNSIIWGALLSGCKLCKNYEIAEIAVSKLMVLEPENCGYYTLLVNMYAEANRWTKVARIRTRMKEQGVEKTCPGSSWIETGQELHQFSATDKFHPAASEVYFALHELVGQMKLNFDDDVVLEF